jgi:hypothetical protein
MLRGQASRRMRSSRGFNRKEAEMLIATTAGTVSMIVVFTFVILTIGFAIYAIVRPFTHARYHRSKEKLFQPLD